MKCALFGPCESLKPAAIQLLIQLGADPNAVWENGGTPLDMAICSYMHKGRSETIETLVVGGANYEDGPEWTFTATGSTRWRRALTRPRSWCTTHCPSAPAKNTGANTVAHH